MVPLNEGATGRGIRGRVLPRSFFQQPPETLAPALLGKILARRQRTRLLAGRIVEVEAYLGSDDPAAHAFRGETPRNAVLFGAPGHAYVYSIYGLHCCLNVSCQPAGVAGCVLLRALEPLQEIAAMRRNRGLEKAAALAKIASGPGKLCAAFAITRMGENGCDLTSANSELFLMDDGTVPEKVSRSPRIGIRKAADWPMRFFVAGNACVSRGGR